MDWISVDDALPIIRPAAEDRSDTVALWERHPTPDKSRPRLGHYSLHHGCFLPPHPGEFKRPITHWMPLPRGPRP